MFNKTQRKWEEQEITLKCATLFLWKKKKVCFRNCKKGQEHEVQLSSFVLQPPEFTVCRLTAEGLLPGVWRWPGAQGFALFFFLSFLVLTEDLIAPGTCLTRITCISGMTDLSRWLYEGRVPIPGQAKILALSAVTLAAFNVCSSPCKYCLGSEFGQLWHYCTICNLYTLLNLWLALWLRGSFSTPAVSPPRPCALGGTIQCHWLDSSWQGEQ